MKIGVMNDPSKSIYDQTIAFGKAGFDFLDLTIEGPKARDVDTEKMLSILERYNLTLTGHTDPCLPWAYPIPTIRQACLDELERCAMIFRALGAKIMNIHPCYYCPPAMKKDLVRLNIEALKSIVAMATSYELTLVLENFMAPFDSVHTYAQLLQEVPGLKIHLDFGHANLGRDDGVSFCKDLGNYISHVHFSDNRATEDDHMPLGVGNIDWEKAITALKSIGYDDTITLEVFCDNKSVLFQHLETSRRLVLNLWNK